MLNAPGHSEGTMVMEKVRSTDGVHWASNNLRQALWMLAIRKVTYGNSIFAAVTGDGKIVSGWYYPDVLSKCPMLTSGNGGGKFIAAGRRYSFVFHRWKTIRLLPTGMSRSISFTNILYTGSSTLRDGATGDRSNIVPSARRQHQYLDKGHPSRWNTLWIVLCGMWNSRSMFYLCAFMTAQSLYCYKCYELDAGKPIRCVPDFATSFDAFMMVPSSYSWQLLLEYLPWFSDHCPQIL